MTRLLGHLVVPVYQVDLAEAVNKYIGETEKSLGEVFEEAGFSGGVLLFDEADALFGRRTEVQDAHDGYANVEISDVVDAVSAKQDLDEAFIRRLRHMIAFSLPGPAERKRIWDDVIPSHVRRALQLLVTGFALYVVFRWMRRCCRSSSSKSVRGDEGDAVEQKVLGAKAERAD